MFFAEAATVPATALYNNFQENTFIFTYRWDADGVF
jgi:hypothetical protein